ncbi:hypothetical protein M404DRAFT_171693, partial [Pisolithus tinctorius Marx 270]
MVQFDGPELTKIEPDLRPCERRLKVYYHNECSFHANDNTNSAWIIKDARKIIYPGANGDAWWTHDNLLTQMQYAIQIHEEVCGPGVQALFIFDNSSAHATLPPDALRAFDMNKSNGGKQRKQQDTTIPHSNPDPTKWGLLQRMTTPTGEPKGLQAVLEERGFDLTGL